MKRIFAIFLFVIPATLIAQSPIKTARLTADTIKLKNLLSNAPTPALGWGTVQIKNDSLYFLNANGQVWNVVAWRDSVAVLRAIVDGQDTTLTNVYDSLYAHRVILDSHSGTLVTHTTLLSNLQDSIDTHTDTLQAHRDDIDSKEDTISASTSPRFYGWDKTFRLIDYPYITNRPPTMFSLDPDSTVSALYPLNMASLRLLPDGRYTIANIPIDKALNGDTVDLNAVIAGRRMFQIYGIADGAGGISAYGSRLAGILRTDAIDLDTTVTIAGQTGRMKWNDADGTYDIGLGGNQVTLQVGQEQVIKVVNKTGSPIVNGKLVYINGHQGNRPTVAYAIGTSDSTSQVIGMLTQTIPNNEEGFVTISGYVRDIDTDAYTEGDALWLSPTSAGDFTNVEPSVPHYCPRIGYVATSHQTVGKILIDLSVRKSLVGLSDVNGTATTTTGQVPVWNQDSLYFDFTFNVLTDSINKANRLAAIENDTTAWKDAYAKRVDTWTLPLKLTGNTASINAATTSAAGTMSSTDKTKLDAITGTNTGDNAINTRYEGSVGLIQLDADSTISPLYPLNIASLKLLPDSRHTLWNQPIANAVNGDTISVNGTIGGRQSWLSYAVADGAGGASKYGTILRGNLTSDSLATANVMFGKKLRLAGQDYFSTAFDSTDNNRGATMKAILDFGNSKWGGGTGSGEINTASNLGTGAQLFKSKVTYDLQFRTLESSNTALTITAANDTVGFQIATAGASTSGLLTSTDWNTFNNKVSNATHTGDVTGATALTIANKVTMTATSPVSVSGAPTVIASSPVAISIADAAADGSTKGAASFTAADFNASSGNISIDYTNAQSSSASAKGFLTAADWTRFNNKVDFFTLDADSTISPEYPFNAASLRLLPDSRYTIANVPNQFASYGDTTDVNITMGASRTFQSYNVPDGAGGSIGRGINVINRVNVPTGGSFTINNVSLIKDSTTTGTTASTWSADDVYGATRRAIKAYIDANVVAPVETDPIYAADSARLLDKTGMSYQRITGAIGVNDSVYDATVWNNSVRVPTKNAIRDKIESITAASLNAVPTSRTVSTTAPLSGGGALSSDLTLSITAASASAAGSMSSAHYSLVNGATNANTASTIVKRHTDGSFAAGKITTSYLDLTGKLDMNYPLTATPAVMIGSGGVGGAAMTLNVPKWVNIKLLSLQKDGVEKMTVDSTGSGTFSGTLTASNLSGTNTGDQTLVGLGGVPSTRTLTINGTSYDLTANRTWSVGTVTSVSSSTTNQLTVTSGSSTPALSVVTGAVVDGGTALATGDQIRDYVVGLGYITSSGSITGSAGSVKSPTTTGLSLFSGPTSGQSRTYTLPNADATLLYNGYAPTGTTSFSLATGDPGSGNTKTINIGSGGTAGSTTNVTIANGTSATNNLYLGASSGGSLTVYSPTVTLPSGTSVGNVSATELQYVDGVTSAIQTQLNGKVGTNAVTKYDMAGTGGTLDCSLYQHINITPSTNITITLSNLSAGMTGNVACYPTGGSVRTITFATSPSKSVVVQPSVRSASSQVSTSSNNFDMFSWYFDGEYLWVNGTRGYY